MAPNLCFVVFVIFLCQKPIEALNTAGFSAQLIRKNSPTSPFHKPHELHKHHRSQSFYQVPKKSPSSHNNGVVATGVTSNNGEYVLKFSLGTPPVDIYGVLDTGSDLIWTQCTPCKGCYKQKNPMFVPQNSKTYNNIKCDTKQCNFLSDAKLCSAKNLCGYGFGYDEGSSTIGVLATETATFSSTKDNEQIVIDNILFGCGHNNTGKFNEDWMGVIGLGSGPLSLVSQISNHFGGPKKFSQCLVPFHTDPSISGTISFGDVSEVSGEGVVKTPLISEQGETTYSVILKGISVGDKFFPLNHSSEEISDRDIVIDSGTSTTYIPYYCYDRLVGELKEQIKMAPINNDPSLGKQLCYSSDKNFEAPILTAHFDGADVKLMTTQTFISPKDGVFCFAMAGADDGVNIFGNFAQSNILIGFDLDAKIVSFKPTDCTSKMKKLT